MLTSSVAKPAISVYADMQAARGSASWSSAAQPAKDGALICFYNIGWIDNRFNNLAKHTATLKADLLTATEELCADAIFLLECGEIEKGLPKKEWLDMLADICGQGFDICHQSHYTSIIRLETMEIVQEPTLKGPLTMLKDHDYRKCQHLQVRVRDCAAEPIDIFNVHSPDSKKRPLSSRTRDDIVKWLVEHISNQTVIGGDLNCCRYTLAGGFECCPRVRFLYEEGHKHGDVILSCGLDAESVPCEVQSTSDAHKMCVAAVKPLSLPPRCSKAEQPAQDEPPVSAYPFADMLFQAMGSLLDTGPDERTLYGELAEQLWTPSDVLASYPLAAKARLNNMVHKALEMRIWYQNTLYKCGNFPDIDIRRSLKKDELALVHNAWMNDVAAWMETECFKQYTALLLENDEVKRSTRQGRDRGRSKGNEKRCGPGQKAHLLKKQRFNKMISDLAMNKAFFMSFVCHPWLLTAEGVLNLLRELNEAKSTPEYKKMLAVSAKKPAELAALKGKRDMARLRLRQGKFQHARHENTKLAELFYKGVLADQFQRADEAYGDRKLRSLRDLIGPNKGE